LVGFCRFEAERYFRVARLANPSELPHNYVIRIRTPVKQIYTYIINYVVKKEGDRFSRLKRRREEGR